jgi:hypothetical protein
MLADVRDVSCRRAKSDGRVASLRNLKRKLSVDQLVRIVAKLTASGIGLPQNIP